MAAIDWVIVLLYAVSTIGLGWYFGRKQEDTSEYFVGSGKMNPILIGVSLFATLLSTISYLAIPGEVLGKGPIFMTNYLAYPLVFAMLGFVILPVYMRQRVTSAYELLEERLGLSVRILGAVMFLMLRLVWMSLLVYLTAKAIAIMIGVGEDMVPWIVLATGIFAVTYTSLGGLRAVVITDLMQTLLLYGGALLVIGTVTWQMGGFGWFPTEWQQDVWDHQPLFSLDPSTRITVVGSLVSVFLWTVCTSAGDQVSVQRFMATEDARSARRAIAMQLTVGFIVGATLGFVGLALLGYFQAHPEFLPNDESLKAQADQLFPHFIAAHLPPVVTGLVVAGLFAAAMSSIDSGVNSITAVVMTDFLDRFGLKPQTERKHLRFARILAVTIGTVVVLLSSVMEHIPGNFMAVTNKTVNLLTVPIALLFFFALYVPFANAAGVWIGTVASVTVAATIAFSGVIFGTDPATGLDPVSFQWISPAALVTGVTIGLIACRVVAVLGVRLVLQIAAPVLILASFGIGYFFGTLAQECQNHMSLSIIAEIRTQSLSVLRDGLESDEFWPSIHAAEALTLAGQQQEVRDHLTPKLKTETDDQKRCGLVRELVRAGEQQRSSVLLKILSDKDSIGRVHAAESLYKVGWIGDGAPLEEAFRQTEDIRLRLMAAAALAKYGKGSTRTAAFAFLRQTLRDDSDPANFRLAAWVLGRIGADQDRALLRSRLNDTSDRLVRAYLEHSLAALGDPEGKQALLRNLKSDDPAVRTYAAVFAGESGLTEAAPLLIHQLEDENLDARIRAAQALVVLAR